MGTADYRDYAWLRSQVFDEGRTLKDIAAECCANISTVSRHLRRAIPIRSVDDLVSVSKRVRRLNTVFFSRNTAHAELYAEIKARTPYVTPGPGDLRQRLWHIEHGESPPLCMSCGESPTLWDKDAQTYRSYCSSRCSSTHEVVQKKRRMTNLDRRGVEYPAQSPVVRDQYKSTMMQRYGVDHVNKTPVTVEAKRLITTDEYLEWAKTHNMTTAQIGASLGVPQATVSRWMQEVGVRWDVDSSTSAFEREVAQVVRSVVGEERVLTRDRVTIKPLEIDILVPSLGVGIECDGMYYHSETWGKKGRRYHADKTQQAADVGIRLVHIYDGEWRYKRDIVVSRLMAILGAANRTHARKLKVIEVSSPQEREFFDQTHLQGYVPSSYAYALVDENDMIHAMMSFIKSRYSKRADWELLRYSTRLNSTVVGGAAKLFTHFVRNVAPSSIVSYCDLRYGVGRVYRELGFEQIGCSSPNYHYFTPTAHYPISRISFQKHKLASKLPTFDASLTEYQNMLRAGYDRVWDCGNSIWLWRA